MNSQNNLKKLKITINEVKFIVKHLFEGLISEEFEALVIDLFEAIDVGDIEDVEGIKFSDEGEQLSLDEIL